MSNDTRVRLIAEIDATSKGLVDALKSASSTINQTTSGWKAQFGSLKDATNNIGESVKNLSSLVSQVGKIDLDVNGMEQIGNAISSVREGFATVKADVDAFVDRLVSMRAEASSLGMPLEEFQRFADVVKASGISMNDAKGMVQSMREQIQHLADGVPEAQDLFGKLGLTIEQLSSNTVSANFQQLVNAITDTIPASERATQTMQLFKASIDNTLSVVDQYNKATSRQAGGYASDKDVQNAINLSSALANMADKLNGVTANKENDAVATRNLADAEQRDIVTLENAMVAQEKYNQSLDSVISTLSGAKSAYDLFAGTIGNSEVFDISSIERGNAEYSSSINLILELLEKEGDKIMQIIDIQQKLGVPIDTKYVETYASHIDELKSAFMELISMVGDEMKNLMSFPNLDTTAFQNLLDMFNLLKSNVEELTQNADVAKGVLSSFAAENGFYEATKVVDSFKTKIEEAKGLLEKGMSPVIDTSDLDKANEAIERMANDLMNSGSAIEIDDSGIEAVKSSTSEFVNVLADARNGVDSVVSGINGLSSGTVDSIRQDFADIASQVSSLSEEETLAGMKMNDLGEYASEVESKIQSLKDRLAEIGRLYHIDIDTREIDRAIDKLRGIKTNAIKVQIDSGEIGEYRDKLKECQKEVARINEEVSRGIPIWRPAINSIQRLSNGVIGYAREIRNTNGGWEKTKVVVSGLGNVLKRAFSPIGDAVKRMTHFKYATDEAKKSGDSVGNTLKQATLQMLHMGSAVGAVVMAMRKVVDLVKEYAKVLAEQRADEMFRNSAQGMEGVSQQRSEQEKKFETVMGMMKEVASLDDEFKKGNLEALGKRLNVEERLKKLYGITFDSAGAEIIDLDKQIAEKINELKQQTLSSIEGNIESASEVIHRTSDYIKSMDYEHRVITPGADTLIKEAQDTNTKATNERITLMGSKWRMERIDYAGEFLRERRGKSRQEKSEADKKANEEARKKEKERQKTLDEANKKLKEWSHSLTDNERQKALREIMAKYEEMVKAGVNEQEARNTATRAIAEVLKKERDDEKKKNQELLDALNKNIETYKQAYQKYLDAEKGILDAQREYAEAQKDLAREAKSERIQRRRDRIANKLRTFGFQLPENFDINERASQRNRRRKRQQLDTGIGEKLQQWQAGKNVHWTRAERERLGEYQGLQRKDKQLEAAQKQMDAASRTQNAAERLASAADAVRNAALTFNTAKQELATAQKDMDKASKTKMQTNQSLSAKDIFNLLKYNGIERKDVKGAVNTIQHTYKPEETKLVKEKRKMRTRQRADVLFREAMESTTERAVSKSRKRKGKHAGLRVYGVSDRLESGAGLRGLRTKGLSGITGRSISYASQLSNIQRVLLDMSRKTFRVR